MSLIVGQYYRGNPKQKPKQWGPKTHVTSVVLENANSVFGINSTLLDCYYPMWERSGKILHDYVSNTPGNIKNNASWGNEGIVFNDELSQWVDTNKKAPKAGGLFASSSTEWSVMVRARVNHDDTGTIIARGVAIYGDRTFQIFFNGGAISTTTPTIVIRGFANALDLGLDDGDWHTYVVTWDGTNAKAYVDGQFVSTLTVGTATENTGENVLLGARTSGAGFFLDGSIDNYLCYGAALTADQVSNFYDNSYGLIQPPTFRTYFIPDAVSIVNLSGAVSSTTSAIGQIDKHSVLSGFGVDALAISSGLTSNKKDINGSITAGTITEGSLSATKNIIGDVSASTTLSGGTSVVVGLSGDVDAESFPGGQLSITRRLSGDAGAVSFVSGELLLQGTIRLSGSVGASGAIDSQVSVQKQLTGLVDSVTSVLGQVTITLSGDTVYLTGGVNAESDVSGQYSVDKKITGTISATGVIAGGISVNLNLSGDVDAITSVLGEISRIGEGLGIIIDPSIESITATRIIETITIKREIESI